MNTLDFSRRLKSRMDELGLTQTGLVKRCEPYAEKFGIKLTKKNMTQYVNGQHIPRDAKLTAICLALDVDESYFVSGDDGTLIFGEDEIALIKCWRKASIQEKENIAFILRNRGFIPVRLGNAQKNA